MKDLPALTNLYQETLPWALQSPIIRSEHPPKTLEEWYTKATNFYIGHKNAQHLFKKRDDKPTNTFGTPSVQKKFTFSEKKDPNVMDIDRMTVDEQTCLMKEGKCFRCKLFGHLSQDCPNKGQTNNTLTTSTPKWTGKSMASHIRALIALMSDEEKKILEEEGWYGFLKRRTASMSAPPVYIFSVHKSNNNNSFHVDAIITTLEKNELIETQPLVDSGTEEIFMDQNYARKQGLSLTKLESPITARNVDGTKNKQETI
jgi:hypothetical protein